MAQLPMTVLKPEEVSNDIGERSAERAQFFHHAREITIHHDVAAGQQAVCMGGLWDAFAGFGAFRQQIALDDRNVIKMIAKSPGREQPADAGPKHDGR